MKKRTKNNIIFIYYYRNLFFINIMKNNSKNKLFFLHQIEIMKLALSVDVMPFENNTIIVLDELNTHIIFKYFFLPYFYKMPYDSVLICKCTVIVFIFKYFKLVKF